MLKWFNTGETGYAGTWRAFNTIMFLVWLSGVLFGVTMAVPW